MLPAGADLQSVPFARL